MVSIQHNSPAFSGESLADSESWLAAAPAVFAPAELDLIRHACELAGSS